MCLDIKYFLFFFLFLSFSLQKFVLRTFIFCKLYDELMYQSYVRNFFYNIHMKILFKIIF